MSTNCERPPLIKREYISSLGKILVKDYGKKKFYKPDEVKKANKKSTYPSGGTDYICWGMCVFTEHHEFDAYHLQTGEKCNYVAMKTEMLHGLGTSPAVNWTQIPEIDIDSSWLDFADKFGSAVDGVGDVVGDILDGL